MKWVSLSQNKTRRNTKYSTRPHPRALVYRGPASLPGCSEAVADLLSSSSWNFDVRFVGPDEELQIDDATLYSAALYAQPGGGDVDGAFAHLRRHVPAIQQYVRSDRHYREYYDCDAAILARYRNGQIAALKIDYGQGRVAVVGPHPEADESWYRGEGLRTPERPAIDLGFRLIDAVMTR